MTTQSTIIINFFDHPERCELKRKRCRYLIEGRCVLRVVDETKKGISRFIKLEHTGLNFLKDPSCKFLWEKSKRSRDRWKKYTKMKPS